MEKKQRMIAGIALILFGLLWFIGLLFSSPIGVNPNNFLIGAIVSLILGTVFVSLGVSQFLIGRGTIKIRLIVSIVGILTSLGALIIFLWLIGNLHG